MIGRTVSHYRVISRVGAGGMGTVWLAEDTTLHRRVALKFLLEGSAPTEEATVRLVREARAASALDHPHIGTIYEVGDFEGQPFIAMAYYGSCSSNMSSPNTRDATTAVNPTTSGRDLARQSVVLSSAALSFANSVRARWTASSGIAGDLVSPNIERHRRRMQHHLHARL